MSVCGTFPVPNDGQHLTDLELSGYNSIVLPLDTAKKVRIVTKQLNLLQEQIDELRKVVICLQNSLSS